MAMYKTAFEMPKLEFYSRQTPILSSSCCNLQTHIPTTSSLSAGHVRHPSYSILKQVEQV